MIRRIAVIAVIAGLSLTACGTGNDPQTAKSKGSVQGASQDLGSVAVRAAALVTDGTKTWVQMTVINNGADADELDSVLVSNGQPTPLTVELPKGKAVPFGGTDQATLEIDGLPQAPAVGSSVSLSLTFKLAGDMTLQVPVLSASSISS